MLKHQFDWTKGRPENKNFISSSVEELLEKARNIIDNKELYRLFYNAFPNTLDTTVFYQYINNEHDTYVITGDIDAMWLRDSSAQVWPYLSLAKNDIPLQNLIAGVINRQSKYILIDPYANAFNYDKEGSIWENDLTSMKPELHERKWELDSLCYHIRLSYYYWQSTQNAEIFNTRWLESAKLIYQTFKNQQLKDGKYYYSFQRNTPVATDTLPNNGLGNPVKPIGLIASAFRPSDDATILPFLVPANFFAVTSLRQMSEISKLVYCDESFSNECQNLANEVETALYVHAVIHHKKYGKIFAYEVDGFGSHILLDDANVPNLVSLPYLGCIDINDEIYQNTRKFVLSEDNPWYFKGKQVSGVGSIHTGLNKVWPISLSMQGLTSCDLAEMECCIEQISKSHAGTYFIHEAIDKDNHKSYSRPWFAWANSLFAELVIKYNNIN